MVTVPVELVTVPVELVTVPVEFSLLERFHGLMASSRER
jgi:hypothetical protein